jgi:hypothetical protein
VIVAVDFMASQLLLMTNRCKNVLYKITILVNLHFHPTQHISNLELLSGRYFTQCWNDYE